MAFRMKRVVITNTDGEYRVPGPDGREATAYYTDDRADAIATCRLMYAPRIVRIAVKRAD